jgi:hypothetical protein
MDINWDMVTAITGIMSFVMAVIGGLILAATKSIFITKKDLKEHTAHIEQMEHSFNKKLYDSKNITIFITRVEFEKYRQETQKAISTIVSREEWEKSKAYRERRKDENQRIVCSKIDKVTAALNAMREYQGEITQRLSILVGKFEMFISQDKPVT